MATKLVTTSITSGGDGSDSRPDVDAILPDNPHNEYFSNRRGGYVRTRITGDELRGRLPNTALRVASRGPGTDGRDVRHRRPRPGTHVSLMAAIFTRRAGFLPLWPVVRYVPPRKVNPICLLCRLQQ